MMHFLILLMILVLRLFLLKDNEIKAIFIEKDSSTKIANTIGNEGGAKIFELDTITSGEGTLTDYEDRMRENIKVIKESL